MTRWEVWLVRLGFGLTAASGIVYGVMKYFLANPDPDSRVGHPWQPFAHAAHVLLAPAAVLAMGLLLRGHVLPRWKGGAAQRRGSGYILTMAGLPLVFSGYLVQVLTGDAARKWTGWLHAAAGALFTLAFLTHRNGSRLPDDAAEPLPEPQGRLP